MTYHPLSAVPKKSKPVLTVAVLDTASLLEMVIMNLSGEAPVWSGWR
jgi:hypothetical protein